MSENGFRPVITVVRRALGDTVIDVTLDMDGWFADGQATVEGDDALAAACRATCRAVTGLLPASVTVEFVHCQQLDGEVWSSPVVLSSSHFDAGDGAAGEELLGAAFVRTDLLVAGVRATLDGLTRRLAPYVPD